MTDQQNWNGGEGCLGESWTKTRAAFHAPALEQLMMAKAHDTALQAGHDPWDCRQPMRSLTCVQKRSYKRAYRRSLRNGSAWYRGRCLLLEQFSQLLGQYATTCSSTRQTTKMQSASLCTTTSFAGWTH